MQLYLMGMPMMRVRIVRVAVPDAGMDMEMRMRFAGRLFSQMLMLVMEVVHMPVLMLRRLVFMQVLMPFGQMQPYSNGHQRAGCEELRGQRFAEDGDGDQSANEGRGRKIRAGPRSTKMAERQHEQNNTDAIAEEPDQPRADQRARRRPCRTGGACQGEIDGAGNTPLQHRDHCGVAKRNFPRQVVVDRPGKARTGYRQGSDCAAQG